jgi:hypothetical protein
VPKGVEVAGIARGNGLRVVAWAVIVVVAAMVVGSASAHTAKYGSKVKFDGFSPGCKRGCVTATGRVRSGHDACEAGRRVTVFLREPGPDVNRFKGKTDAHGSWEIAVNLALTGEDYYAKVRARNIGPAGHRHICKGDRSPDVTLES